jgi:hypothetical protein
MQDRKAINLRLGIRDIKEGELRVIRQRQLIAVLANNGRPIDRAAALLETMERSLQQIRQLVASANTINNQQ